MRVLCIDNKGIRGGPISELEENKDYNVIGEDNTHKCRGEHYILEGPFIRPRVCPVCHHTFPPGIYLKRRFIPLSDIDETDRIEKVLETIFVNK